MNQRSELRIAMSNGDHTTISRLVKEGVQLNSDTKSDLPVAYCVKNNDHKSLRLLLKKGADINNMEGANALVVALKMKDKVAIQLLLQYGADPNKENSFGRTAVQEAEEMKNAELSSLLIQK